MDRKSYHMGFEDALELLLINLKRKKIEVPKEIREEISYLISAVKEDKIEIIKRELGIF